MFRLHTTPLHSWSADCTSLLFQFCLQPVDLASTRAANLPARVMGQTGHTATVLHAWPGTDRSDGTASMCNMSYEVPNILCDPGNIENLILRISQHSWKYWKPDYIHLLISKKYWKPVFSIFYYPGNAGNWSLHYSQNPGNIGNVTFVFFVVIFAKKDARRNFTQNPPINEPRSLIWDRFRAQS